VKKPSNFKFSILCIALAFGTVTTQALAIGTADDTGKTVYTTAFEELDTDKNGSLSKAEVKTEKHFTKSFAAADKNHDGSLDQQEYTDHRTQAEKKYVKRVASDSVITSKIKGKLLEEEGFKSLKVSVETHQGIVLLSGFVTTEAQIQQAEKIAADTEGVKSVKNSLILKKD
jgi:hyperosmotically inducible protein